MQPRERSGSVTPQLFAGVNGGAAFLNHRPTPREHYRPPIAQTPTAKPSTMRTIDFSQSNRRSR